MLWAVCDQSVIRSYPVRSACRSFVKGNGPYRITVTFKFHAGNYLVVTLYYVYLCILSQSVPKKRKKYFLNLIYCIHIYIYIYINVIIMSATSSTVQNTYRHCQCYISVIIRYRKLVSTFIYLVKILLWYFACPHFICIFRMRFWEVKGLMSHECLKSYRTNYCTVP